MIRCFRLRCFSLNTPAKQIPYIFKFSCWEIGLTKEQLGDQMMTITFLSIPVVTVEPKFILFLSHVPWGFHNYAGGAEMWARMPHEGAWESWVGLRRSLSGLYCASLDGMDDSRCEAVKLRSVGSEYRKYRPRPCGSSCTFLYHCLQKYHKDSALSMSSKA